MAKTVKRLPIDKILLETDSPALAHEKGVINEPQNLVVAASAIAEIKGLPLEEVKSVTKDNFMRLFCSGREDKWLGSALFN